MPTKKEWQAYLKDRKKWEKAYAKETLKLEKSINKMPPSGEVVAFDGPGSHPGTPPPNPPGTPPPNP